MHARRWQAGCVGALALLAGTCQAAETLRYVLMTSDGHVAGEQVVEHGDDGRTRVRYIFKNNGRGPELEETIRRAPDGTLAEYEVKGQAAMGGPVSERFTRSGDQAQWQTLDETAAGKLLMPHIVPAGFLEGRSTFSSRLGRVIETLDEAKAAVDWYAQHGYRQIKIYNSFPRAHLRETVAHAHRRGLRVSGHVPAFLRAQDVVAMGFDEVQHINQLMLNFLVKPGTDTRTLERFYLPAEKLARFDLRSKAARDFIALLKKHRTVIDPTLATFDFLKQRDGEVPAPYSAVMPHLPPNVQRYYLSGGMKIADAATAARYRASYDTMVAFVGLAYRAGVPIVAGTDALAGFTLHSELALYVKAGLTPAQALQVATLNGARYSGTLHERGSIQPGKRADLVLVDGDPTRDIADLRKVALVITQGKLIRPADVHRMLGVQPFVADTYRLEATTSQPDTQPDTQPVTQPERR